MVLASATFLFSFLPAIGQTDPDKDRTLSRNTNSADRRHATRSVSRSARAGLTSKLPFEQSVIIYYNGSGRTPASSKPAVSTSRTDPAIRKSEDPKKQPIGTALFSADQPVKQTGPPRRADTVADLQPVIIYYGTYRPSVRSSEEKLPDPNVKPAAATSLIRDESKAANLSLRTAPEPAMRPVIPPSALSSDPPGGKEQPEPKDGTRNVSEDILGPSNLVASSKETRATGPKQHLSKPTDSEVPLGQRAVNAPEIETSNPTVEEKVEESVAPNIDVAAAARQRQKADVPQQNSANAIASSSLRPSSLSPTTPEEPAPAALTSAAPGNSGAPPTGNSAGLETESGAVDAVELNNSAVRLALEHQYAEARAFLQRAIEGNPTSATLHRNLSVVFERMKKVDEALASAQSAAKLAPSDASVLEQLCGLELIAGNTAVAVGCYEKLKSIEPLDALSQTYYGLAMFRSGKEDESITILAQAAQSTPPLAEAMNALGVVYYKKKRFDDAVAAFKNAVEVSPDLLEMRFNLAVAQLALRNRAAAISQYNIIKAGNPKLADKLYRMLHGDRVLFVNDNKNPK